MTTESPSRTISTPISSLLRTPPRRSSQSYVSSRNTITMPSSIYRTPSKTPQSSRHHYHHRRPTIPRMSPMTDRSRSNSKTPYYTPRSTPSSCSSSDRYIPSRRRTNIEVCRRALLTSDKKRPRNDQDPEDDSTNSSNNNLQQETPLQKEFKRRMLSSLCNIPLDQVSEEGQPLGLLSFGGGSGSTSTSTSASSSTLVATKTTTTLRMENPYSHDTLRNVLGEFQGDDARNTVAQKIHRKVSGAPTRILDAPDIVNDYYLQLISWGKDNVLAVALAQSVYLWNATTGEIQHLVSTEAADDYITSVSWCTIPGRTKYIAVGTNANVVHIYDAEVLRKVRTLTGHSGRVCSLAWSHQWLTSGARDSLILQHDIRSHDNIVSTYEGHEQEVCGLKWNDEGTTLASGGNENYLCLWDAAMSSRNSFQQRRRSSNDNHVAPRLVLNQHKAAVKALDWCPFHRGLLASGGGTADRTIKFWNSSSGALLNSIDTGSQVCSVLWSKHQRELCSSHGYSENQLILWKYPTMTKVKELTGHTERVLNMDMSPDGASVVSAAADETLRFWNVFGTPSCRSSTASGLVSMSGELSFGVPTIR